MSSIKTSEMLRCIKISYMASNHDISEQLSIPYVSNVIAEVSVKTYMNIM